MPPMFLAKVALYVTDSSYSRWHQRMSCVTPHFLPIHVWLWMLLQYHLFLFFPSQNPVQYNKVKGLQKEQLGEI